MAITDILNVTPQLVAEQNPELHQMRKIAFGENYLQDIAQDTGTAQYYSGWGNVPSWAQQAMTTDEAYTTPAVTGTTTNIGVGEPDAGIMSVAPTADTISGIPGSMPTVPAGGIEGGVWGPQDYLQPPMDQAGAVAAMTQPEAYDIPGTMPQTPVNGVWGPQDYLQPSLDQDILTEQTSEQLMDPTMLIPQVPPYTDRIMDPNLMRIEQERAIQDASYPIAGLSTNQKQLYNQLDTSNLIDPNNAGKDKYGKNIITGADEFDILGNTYEEGVREYVEKHGDKEYTTPLAQQKQKDYNALVDAWDERDAVTGILPPSRLSPEETIAPKTALDFIDLEKSIPSEIDYGIPIEERIAESTGYNVGDIQLAATEEGAELGDYATPENINKAINFLTRVGGALALGTPLTIKAITAQLAKQRVAGDVLGKTLGTIASIGAEAKEPTPTVTTAVAPPSILSRPAPVYHAPIAGGGGNGGGGGYSGDPGGGVAGSPFAKGGRVGYKKGGIVDLL